MSGQELNKNLEQKTIIFLKGRHFFSIMEKGFSSGKSGPKKIGKKVKVKKFLTIFETKYRFRNIYRIQFDQVSFNGIVKTFFDRYFL